MNSRSRLSILLLSVLCLPVTLLVLQPIQLANAKTTTTPLPPINLIVVGADGNVAILNETGMVALPAYTGYGGFKNQLGNINALGSYTGVPLTTLCGLVGGLTNTSVVKILAADNYTQTLTHSQVNGNFTTYDNVTGLPVQHNQSVTPILAYYFNGQNLTASDGPLKLAIVGPEGAATDAAYWVRQVVRIEVTDQAVPEFPQPILLPMLLLAALATLSCISLHSRRQHRTGKANKNDTPT